ncbi:sulfite exporter TauE/SafE family protein [Methylomicrobium sp. Wu6]|uniref:sulfite exporter TauE/SafE family protein n=1 Tax=Methylomicrobium sp. Wu6 TaxID=3107928 RepID=UPI002DD6B709|nr:sulfite exporter TauE/SafE family protein [Methylomicrobium sp. Wu6]MEC4749989.1 sulfite exporter TauE/SafE family protein [Methylomicrobium sp. Wu6]
MIILFIASMMLGTVAGLFAGLFGIGGGLIMVPVLAMLFAMQGFAAENVMIMAVATSLATIILTAVASVIAHHRLGAVLWGKVLRLAPGIMVGSALGAVIADRISGEVLRYIFIVYLLYAALQLALQRKPSTGRKPSSRFLDHTAGLVIGGMSAIIGIGGGTLTVPYLVYFQIPIRNAVAVSSACGLPIAVAGAASYILLGWQSPLLPEWSLGYIYLPSFIGIVLTSVITAPIGAKLASSIPAQKLKRYFSLLLLVVAAKMIWF